MYVYTHEWVMPFIFLCAKIEVSRIMKLKNNVAYLHGKP